MSDPQSSRSGAEPAKAFFASNSPDTSATASVDGSGFLSGPSDPHKMFGRGSHARSRSVGDPGNTSTVFHFGYTKPPDFTFKNAETHSPVPLSLSSAGASQASITSSHQTTNSQSGLTIPVFRFGRQQESDISEHHFSFRSFHNATPLTSPRASPKLRSSDVASRIRTPSPGPNPIATANISSGHLSPPDFSHNRASPTAASVVTNRMRSLSVAAAPTNSGASTAAISTSTQQPTHSASREVFTNSSQGIGSEVPPRPYDPRDEPAPAHPFFTSNFQLKLRNGIGIAKETVATIEKLGAATELDHNLERLLKEAKGMTTFHGSDTRKIAVLGDSGEGLKKSFNSSYYLLQLTDFRKEQPGQLIASFSRNSADGLYSSAPDTYLEILTRSNHRATSDRPALRW